MLTLYSLEAFMVPCKYLMLIFFSSWNKLVKHYLNFHQLTISLIAVTYYLTKFAFKIN